MNSSIALPGHLRVQFMGISAAWRGHFLSIHSNYSSSKKYLCILEENAPQHNDAKNEPTMSEYIVSARKYRPDSFESLIGQDTIAQTLKNSIKRGQLAHAYLFCGPRGVGKTSAARIFAKTINCENLGEDIEPCGHCESCVSFQEGRSYCIHELDAASNNGVEDIKTLMEQVQIPPQVGRYSVFIIDEVHMLTTNAFNAFLKTLEEPPAHAIFILATTEKHKILPTILSRCQTYDFNRISIPDIVRNLRDIAGKESITIDDASLHIIAQKADGAMRDALTIFDQTVAFCGTDVKYEDVIRNLNVLDYENCFKLVEFFLKGDYESSLLKFDEILSKGFNAIHFVGALSSHFRDLLVARSGGADSLLNLPDNLKEQYREQASRCPIQFLFDAMNMLSACESAYRTSVNPRLLIELTLMKLSFYMSREVAVTPAQRAAQAPSQAHAAPAPPKSPIQAPAPPAQREQAPPIREGTTPPTAPQQQPSPSQGTASAPSSPATSQGPAPTAERGRRGAKVNIPMSGLSISAAQQSIQQQKAVVEAISSSEGDVIPSDEKVMEVWKTLPTVYAKKMRLAETLAHAKTAISESDGLKYLTFFVMNVPQKQWIEDKILREIEGKVIQGVGSTKVRVLVDVTPDEQVEAKPYTAKEKAEALMQQNAEVKNIIQDLNLDV